MTTPTSLTEQRKPLDESFLEAVQKRVVLADGAMGTQLYQRGVYINQCYEGLNLSRAHLIAQVHKAYIQAGSELIETNTYGAHRLKLEGHGLAEQVEQINRKAVQIAREAAGNVAWVAGSVGPPGPADDPMLASDLPELAKIYREQIEALVDEGVDALLFETFSDLNALECVVGVGREVAPDLPIIVQVMFTPNLQTIHGTSVDRVTRIIDQWPVDVIGSNCGTGPAELLKAVEQMREQTDKPISIQPNAGSPVRHEERYIYLATPEYFMEYLRRAIQLGAHLVGGCCGSGPEHIKAIKASVRMLHPGEPSSSASEATIEVSSASRRDLQAQQISTPSRFADKLRKGQFVVSVEIDPPVGTDPTSALEAAKICESAQVDCINIADGPRATARMGPTEMALLLTREVPGVEPIIHLCCRDRNILGLQADLIGDNALGLHNILIITGDPPKLGDYPYATAVYDVDAIGALKIANHLNHGQDLAGNPLRGAPTQLHLGCGANPGALDLDEEIARLEQKILAGAEYVFTQPVYQYELFERFYERVTHIKVPILLGVLPLASLRNAEFLTREVPGMAVPDEILARLRACTDKENARQTGIEIAREMLAAALPHIQGVYIMPPFNRVESALAVLEVAHDKIADTQ